MVEEPGQIIVQNIYAGDPKVENNLTYQALRVSLATIQGIMSGMPSLSNSTLNKRSQKRIRKNNQEWENLNHVITGLVKYFPHVNIAHKIPRHTSFDKAYMLMCTPATYSSSIVIPQAVEWENSKAALLSIIKARSVEMARRGFISEPPPKKLPRTKSFNSLEKSRVYRMKRYALAASISGALPVPLILLTDATSIVSVGAITLTSLLYAGKEIKNHHDAKPKEILSKKVNSLPYSLNPLPVGQRIGFSGREDMTWKDLLRKVKDNQIQAKAAVISQVFDKLSKQDKELSVEQKQELDTISSSLSSTFTYYLDIADVGEDHEVVKARVFALAQLSLILNLLQRVKSEVVSDKMDKLSAHSVYLEEVQPSKSIFDRELPW